MSKTFDKAREMLADGHRLCVRGPSYDAQCIGASYHVEAEIKASGVCFKADLGWIGEAEWKQLQQLAPFGPGKCECRP